MSQMTSGSRCSRLARHDASHVEETKARTSMVPKPNTLTPPKIGIVNKT